MPTSLMTLFPHVLNSLEVMKVPVQTSVAVAEALMRANSMGFGLIRDANELGCRLVNQFIPLTTPLNEQACRQLSDICQEGSESILSVAEKSVLEALTRFHRKRSGELEFMRFFTDPHPPQDWTVSYDDTNILLDLPSLRVIDISLDVKHKILNYGVVFAPRAGNHSNIAERVAIHMRDQGLSRMAVVEQKCAQDIPLCVQGERHYEDFDGQVDQYRKALEYLKDKTGCSPHLIAVCQPGPLLMSTLILNPELGRTFGSAGAPMHTEGERGYLTDFARMVGENYMERLLALLGHTICDEHDGAGRECYDGRLQVLGFYFLGIDRHLRNFRKLLGDLRHGNEEDAKRQKTFYQWYNAVHHFPASFVTDTFKKIFVRNELIRGVLSVAGKRIGIEDYPGSVPIWALGGAKDEIAPPLQATGHMELINSVPQENKLLLICEGGHTGLFRSKKVLKNYYNRIVEFMLANSDY
jgi:polyhydroxyalkanoate depolymerase